MGGDKATTMLAGASLLQRVVDEVAPLFPALLIGVRKPRPELPWPQLCDADGVAGPMAALLTALRAIKTRWLFVVGCDMPLIAPALIRSLAALRNGQEAVVPMVAGRMQPLLAFYAARSLPAVEQAATGGDYSLQALLRHLQTTVVDEAACRRHDPELRSFMDLDTPEAVTKAAGCLRL